MIFLFLFVFMFFVAVGFYKKQRPQWTKNILWENEELLYTQVKTTVYTKGSDGIEKGMAYGVVKMTNKRIFFLYPDKKAISKVLDFSSGTQSKLDEKLQRNTLYIDRIGMRIESDAQGRSYFFGKAQSGQGGIVEYRFFLQEKDRVKEILGI